MTPRWPNNLYAFLSRPVLHHYATALVEPPMIRTSIDTATSGCPIDPVEVFEDIEALHNAERLLVAS